MCLLSSYCMTISKKIDAEFHTNKSESGNIWVELLKKSIQINDIRKQKQTKWFLWNPLSITDRCFPLFHLRTLEPDICWHSGFSSCLWRTLCLTTRPPATTSASAAWRAESNPSPPRLSVTARTVPLQKPHNSFDLWPPCDTVEFGRKPMQLRLQPRPQKHKGLH